MLFKLMFIINRLCVVFNGKEKLNFFDHACHFWAVAQPRTRADLTQTQTAHTGDLIFCATRQTFNQSQFNPFVCLSWFRGGGSFRHGVRELSEAELDSGSDGGNRLATPSGNRLGALDQRQTLHDSVYDINRIARAVNLGKNIADA